MADNFSRPRVVFFSIMFLIMEKNRIKIKIVLPKVLILGIFLNVFKRFCLSLHLSLILVPFVSGHLFTPVITKIKIVFINKNFFLLILIIGILLQRDKVRSF